MELITNNSNTTQPYNIGNGNTDESFEHGKPTINGRLDNMHISLDQVKSQMGNYPMGQTTNDDVDMLKSKIDDIELMLENRNKLISDIEASIKHCISRIYCKLRLLQLFDFMFYIICMNIIWNLYVQMPKQIYTTI